MRHNRIGLVAGLLLAAQLAGTGCILIPKIEKRNVRLVVSQVATVPLPATGSINSGTYTAGPGGISLGSVVDFQQALGDAGFDASQVDSIKIGKIEYRVSVADPTPSRAITNGHVQINVSGGPAVDLITGFTHSAGAVTPWLRAPVTTAGVQALNQLLAGILLQLQGGPNVLDNVGFAANGDSAPLNAATSFTYEFRLTILISGKVKTDVLN